MAPTKVHVLVLANDLSNNTTAHFLMYVDDGNNGYGQTLIRILTYFNQHCLKHIINLLLLTNQEIQQLYTSRRMLTTNGSVLHERMPVASLELSMSATKDPIHKSLAATTLKWAIRRPFVSFSSDIVRIL